MVVDPQRRFHRHVACTLYVRALADVLDGDDQWPSKEHFAASHVDCSYTAVLPYTQFQWLKTLYHKLLQVFHRVAAICSWPVDCIFSRTFKNFGALRRSDCQRPSAYRAHRGSILWLYV